MAIPAPYKARLLVGDLAAHAYTKSASPEYRQAMLDTTVISDEAKTYIVGQLDASLTIEGLLEAAQFTDFGGWSSSGEPITFAPAGLALGTQVTMLKALRETFAPSTALADPAAFSLTAQSTEFVDEAGVSLHDLLAVTADESGTGHDGGAATSGGAVAHLHVTAFSGFSGADVIVEDSANNSTWATIGTFATVAGVTAERLTIAGTVRRYTRYSVDVTGSGSITFAVALARH